MLQNKVIQEFQQRFGERPALLVRAPGRVNLIGEHTDYNDGFVLPMAIDRAVWIALRPRSDSTVKLTALDFNNEEGGFHIHRFEKSKPVWLEYIKGTAWALKEAGFSLQGWEGVLAGDVPIGGGLSSSAAMELATARAFAALGNWQWEPARMALLAQRAENEWIGMKCGIMDQMISASGKKDHAMLLDCRSLEIRLVSLPPGTAVVIMDTATRRELVDSAYNERRSQCFAVAKFFGVPALRDVTMAQLEAKRAEIDPLAYRRARHIITENERTVEAAHAMEAGDAQRMGLLMDESHLSMRDDFEISRVEMDVMVEIAQCQTGCFGARMTGGGFGGCAVAMVTQESVAEFTKNVAASYEAATHLKPSLYVCSATNGAEIVQGEHQ